MHAIETVTNRFGDQWTLEFEESDRLTSIDGFLMVYQELSRITLSKRLTSEDKARAHERLLEQLAQMPLGRAGVILWHRNDE